MDTQKLQILDENKGKPGVYLIRNLKNNKFYVGSSIDIRRRFKEYFSIDHLLRRNKLPICAALSKYGYSLFSVEILEYCDTSILLIFIYKKKNAARLSFGLEREQHFLNMLKPFLIPRG
jgi:group I intron endonuclease